MRSQVQRGEVLPASHGRGKEDVEMHPLADQASLDGNESVDSAQAGVKRLEAISSTWTKAGLYAAYLGYVKHALPRVRSANAL